MVIFCLFFDKQSFDFLFLHIMDLTKHNWIWLLRNNSRDVKWEWQFYCVKDKLSAPFNGQTMQCTLQSMIFYLGHKAVANQPVW